MADIHPTSIVAPGAELGTDVRIGPFCTIGPNVRIGTGTRLLSHAVIDGHTTLGAECTVFPFASIGLQTQDLKFAGGAPRVEIGARTTLREYVTVNAATNDGDVTRVGDDCLIMACAHVAHDCVVGNRVILANSVALAGHVTVEDFVIIGGLSAVHQFVRLGRNAYVGGCCKIVQDVPPFFIADGNPATIPAINSVGLKRAGFPEDSIRAIKLAHRHLYRGELTTSAALEAIERDCPGVPEIRTLLDFVRSSERGIVK